MFKGRLLIYPRSWLQIGLVFFSLQPVVVRAASSFQFKAQTDLYVGYLNQQKANSQLNVDNRILEIPDQSVLTDLRPDLKILYLRKIRLILRPRLLVQGENRSYDNPFEQRRGVYSKWDLSDGYVDFALSGGWVFSAGLQSYQWGPAEFLSPSNPLFHFQTDGKSYLYKEKGKGLIKLGGSFDKYWSMLALFEAFSNAERPWIAERNFETKALLKIEKKFTNSFNYIGLTMGYSEGARAFLGEYANWVMSEGYSLYLDARHNQSNLGFVPTLNSAGLYDLVPAEDDLKINTLATVGFRVEGAADFRLEYVYNQLGYNQETLGQALQAGTFPSLNLVQNLQRLDRPGKEMLGQRYIYSSIRFPDFLSSHDLTAMFRYIRSLQDNSRNFQTSFDKPLSDTIIGMFETSLALGEDTKEFTLGNRVVVFAGMKWTN